MNPLPAAAPDLLWLNRLRWAAVAGQSLAIAVAVLLLNMALPVLALGGIIAAETLLSLICSVAVHRGWKPSWLAAVVILVLDVGALTGLLALAGGSSNPFTLLYLVHVVLAGVLLGTRAALILLLASALLFGSFFVIEGEHVGHDDLFMHWHLRGMWFAVLAAGGLLVVFVGRILSENERQRHALDEAVQRERQTRVRSSLASLAAGAAHELGTPLSTIALVAGEMGRALRERGELSSTAAEDVALLRSEVSRCQTILHDMSVAGGHTPAIQSETIAVSELCRSACEVTNAPERIRMDPTDHGRSAVHLPVALVRRALSAILSNALDASPLDQPVELSAQRVGDDLFLAVADRGPGITPEYRERVREPFYTTKQPGDGMGLGLYLADSVARDLGGSLEIMDRPGGGAIVRLQLPTGASP